MKNKISTASLKKLKEWGDVCTLDKFIVGSGTWSAYSFPSCWHKVRVNQFLFPVGDKVISVSGCEVYITLQQKHKVLELMARQTRLRYLVIFDYREALTCYQYWKGRPCSHGIKAFQMMENGIFKGY